MREKLLAGTGCMLVLSLSACGGGGGGGGPAPAPAPVAAEVPPPAPTPTPTPTPTPSSTTVPMTGTPTPRPTGGYDTIEYRNSNAAVVSGALPAYDGGWTGRGVKLGVIDSGINPSLSEFTGRIDSASRDVTGANRPLADEDGHGTAVAATAAAAKDGVYIHGVAPDATVVMMRADTAGTCTADPDKECSFGDPAIATGVRVATDAGAKVINLSLGGDPPGAALLGAFSYAVGKGVVLVISAGNDGAKPEGANADPFAAVPAAQFAGSVIVAGSVGTFNGDLRTTTSTDTISPFSNRAGTSANYTLMALGAGVKTINQDGARYYYSGTSFSAPTISGAVALLAQAYPNLTGQQIVKILFASADDLGAAGIDNVYGRGRLNVARAFQPIGTATLAGTDVAVAASSTAPSAVGDAGGKALGAIILDGFSRPFAVDLAAGLRQAPQQPLLARSLTGNVSQAGASTGPVSVAMTVTRRTDLRQGFALAQTGIGPNDLRQARLVAGTMVASIDNRTAVALGFREGAKAMQRRLSGVASSAFLTARDVTAEPGFDANRGSAMAVRHQLGAVGITLAGEAGQVARSLRPSLARPDASYRSTSLTVDRRYGGTALSAGLTRLDEDRTVLGGEFTAALGGVQGARTTFLDLEARRDFGRGWSGGLSARQGWTSFGSGAFRTRAYGLDLAKTGLLTDGDLLGFRLSQPLKVVGGGLDLLLPTAWSFDTMSPTLQQTRYGLTPSGREVDAELGYSRRLQGGKAWLGTNLFARRQPGHIADAPADIGGAVRYSLGF
ncbi:S8 family serine peptidase [Sphingomonas sp. BN140010]|uniref:S8 family serine peptidase n=1 Tax=Sphingomonas arvum TaxID=2992113 RepID=A0ABT3JFH4_9SPHN|nr:S8 family peptidase [Sphingomonas sp. BN140010]MCW3797828.1 S8 family serine peptidase [Sphingomonas sp. BN140010]